MSKRKLDLKYKRNKTKKTTLGNSLKDSNSHTHVQGPSTSTTSMVLTTYHVILVVLMTFFEFLCSVDGSNFWEYCHQWMC
jgi:hypothetical protein